jgi:biotin synthase-related radical SAM superfamily protein
MTSTGASAAPAAHSRVSIPLTDSPPAGADRGHSSPDWVRLSGASAIALRVRSGRFSREFDFGGINLLLNYEDGCRSDCAYCGLARTRPGSYEDKSFIRVEWPLVETDLVVQRMATYQDKLTRLCISMVTHPFAYRDTCEITSRIRDKVATPLSILVAPPTLNRRRVEELRRIGVDMIGIGLDAATEQLFRRHRTEVPAGGAGLSWDKYWSVVKDAREIFGPWKVNCHLLVGLGENDRDLVEMFFFLRDWEVFSYLFCFNPEPDSRLGGESKSELTRWRRVQLVKHLIENDRLAPADLSFNDDGSLARVRPRSSDLDELIGDGVAFMTNGCPGENGEPGCTRPYGSYRPSEQFRDFPFLPDDQDLRQIRVDLALDEIIEGV